MDYRLGRNAAAGYGLAVHDSLGSTNTEALERARAGEAGPLWVVARRQEAGRGRRGNVWTSPPGNLAASLLIGVDDVAADTIATLGFVAGIALVDAARAGLPLSPLAGRGLLAPCRASSERSEGEGAHPNEPHPERPPHPRLPPRRAPRQGGDAALSPPGGEREFAPISGFPALRLKWPNDILLDGAKLAGILLEAETAPGGRRFVVVGFGVNVAAAPEGLPYAAACLSQGGHAPTAEDLFEALSESMIDAMRLWRRGHGFSDVRARWLASAAGLGEPVTVRLGDSQVQGIFETIDEAGRLVVEMDDGTRRTVTAGEVHLGTAATAA